MTASVAQASLPACSSDCLSTAAEHPQPTQAPEAGGTPALQALLLDPAAYPHPADQVRLIETHISWVFLAGDYAYKLKKPVDYGFLDFSTLDKREHCCREEVRLNRRLAPDIYLAVVAVAGEPPRIGGTGPVLEWAVKMRAFPADATLDREPAITPDQIDAIADRVAAFHGEIAAAPADSAYGELAAITAPVEENFRQIQAWLPNAQVDDLYAWSQTEARRLSEHFAARKAAGCIRECHGDLHLANIAWVDHAVLLFDGIEFNPGLRFIDVISEAAFLCMDLMHRGLEALAARFLNRYLEHTGDYAGLAALSYYLVYRALVRAKVAGLRASQSGGDFSETRAYLDLARRIAAPGRPALILMHGVSGSGKSHASQFLLERLPAIRIRSDVERKRLFGLRAADSSQGQDIYSREAGERTRKRLLDLANTLLDAGNTVIVDATFIRRDWRDPFRDLAAERGLPCLIASLNTPPEALRQRILRRQAEGRDASEAGLAVLESQLANQEPFGADECSRVIALRGESESDTASILTSLA